MTSPTFPPCPECRTVGAHRFDCSLNPRIRAATPEQLQVASRPPGVPPGVPPDTASPRATCLFCGGRGTLHARGGAATGTCPLPPSGCGGSGTVDAATRAAQEAQRSAPSALAVFHSSPSSPLVEAARILDAGLARPPGTVAPTPPIASPALTVGAAIKVPHVAEYQHPEHPGRWFQAKAGNWHRWWRPDAIGGPSWSMWTVPILDSDLALPCRLVAAKDADLDPSTRAPLASPLLAALAVDDSKLAVPSQLREVNPHELPERGRALTPEPDHEADVGADGAGVEVAGGVEVHADGVVGGHAKSIAAAPPTRKQESTAMRGTVDLVACVECQRVVPETDTEETEDGTVCRWCDEEARTPLASPRPAEAERETRCTLACPHGDRCTLAPHDAATGCNHRVCPCNEPNEPGLWTTRAQVREAMHVAVPLTDEADADNLWSVLAAGDDLTKIPREPRRRRGQADPTPAIAAPGLDLPARVAAMLAVADRATPVDEARLALDVQLAIITVQIVGRPADDRDHSLATIQRADLCRLCDALVSLATLRDAPGIIREQQAEIERLRALAAEACTYAEQACAWRDDEAPPPPSGPNLISRRIAAIRAALASKEPTP